MKTTVKILLPLFMGLHPFRQERAMANIPHFAI